MNRDQRGPWYLLTGLVLGVALGLVYAWVLAPVKYVDTVPDMLREDYKAQYRALVAAAYMATGDLPRAQARLDQLNDPEVARTVAIQAQQALAEGRPEAETRALGLLAVALGQGPAPIPTLPEAPLPATDVPAETPVETPSVEAPLATATSTLSVASATPAPTRRTPLPTNTPLPTRTASPTPGAPFVLQDQTLVCNPNLGQPLIQVEAYDAAGQPVPGVEVIVAWNGEQGAGEDRFFTGLKPELGLGYADLVLTPGITYTLSLADGGQPVPDLVAAECESDGGDRYWGSWLLVFAQP
ncbi:MAG TPA: hypothetical protein PKM21_05020 [Anaerolineales bacterium]|nr:hypothetical protein [Anaerolineales bacterium]